MICCPSSRDEECLPVNSGQNQGITCTHGGLPKASVSGPRFPIMRTGYPRFGPESPQELEFPNEPLAHYSCFKVSTPMDVSTLVIISHHKPAKFVAQRELCLYPHAAPRPPTCASISTPPPIYSLCS
jgi:hypothetical protein